ncbi:MAG: hypothetical protein QOJ79_1014, partial [Actinomycetota bacterium]|nr:hypothetical protein [Actinomycetota bacterium]
MSEYLATPPVLSSLTRRVRLGGDAAIAEAVELIPLLPPGPESASLLMSLPASSDRLLQSVVLEAWDRHVSWAQAMLYGAAQPFACSDSPERDNLETVRHALGLSAHGAKNVQAVSRRLFTLFASTLGLLQRGQISRGHVWGLIEMTADLDDHEAGLIEDRVIAEAPGQTIAEFRKALDRARQAVCPEAAQQRHERKVAGRQVTRWTDRDGMGRLLADLPPEDIAAAWEALCRRADQIVQPDDPRGRSARLADALVESITGLPAANDPRRRPDTPATMDDDLEELERAASPRPADAPVAVSPRPAELTDPAESTSGQTAPRQQPPPLPEPAAPSPPPGDVHGDEVEIHVVVPIAQLRGQPKPTAAPDPESTVVPLAPRRTRRARTRRGRRLSSTLWAVIGLDSLLGNADVPGEISTFGAVPATVVRRMAQGRVILRRLVVDERGHLLDAELTVTLAAGSELGAAVDELITAPYRTHPLDYGSTVYRLPADLDRHVVLRDRTCTVP